MLKVINVYILSVVLELLQPQATHLCLILKGAGLHSISNRWLTLKSHQVPPGYNCSTGIVCTKWTLCSCACIVRESYQRWRSQIFSTNWLKSYIQIKGGSKHHPILMWSYTVYNENPKEFRSLPSHIVPHADSIHTKSIHLINTYLRCGVYFIGRPKRLFIYLL